MEDRKQKTENRSQKTENGKQRTDNIIKRGAWVKLGKWKLRK